MAKRAAEVVEPSKTREAIRRSARRAPKRRNPVTTHGLGHQVLDIVKPIGVGALGYGGTRLVQRIAWNLAAKRKPRWARHVHAAAGVLSFGALLFAGSKVKSLEPHLQPALIGSGVAALQGVVTAYVPRFAWVTADPQIAELDQVSALPDAGTSPQAATGDYLEEQLLAYEQPRRKLRPAQQTMQVVAAAGGDDSIDAQLLDQLGQGEDLDDLYGGVFEDPTLSL